MHKIFRVFLVFSFLIFWVKNSEAQTTIQIGTATTIQRENPINRQNYSTTLTPGPARYSVSEYIWTKAEINGNAGSNGINASPAWNQPGCITNIQFYKDAQNSSTSTCNNVKVYMKNSSAVSLTTGNWSTAGYTQVFSGSFNHGGASPGGSGWKTITLNAPFLYDNINNLHVLITNESGVAVGASGASGDAPSWRLTSLNGVTSDTRCRFYWDPNALPTFISASGNRANVRLTFTSAPSSNPPSSITGTNTICQGSSTTLTANGGNSSTRWFTGSCSGTSTGTGTSITVSPATTTTYFAANTAGCDGTALTSCVSYTVTVNPAPSAPSNLTASPNPVCSGQQVTLSGNNTGSNTVWYSGTCGGTQLGTGASVTVSPASTTTYFARNIVSGCQSSCASVQVQTQNAPAQPGTISGSNNVCVGNQNYSISGVSGATSYNWTLNGGGTITGNNTSATVNWTQGGTWTISVTATNSCGTTTARTLQVTVTATPPAQPSAITGNLNPCTGQQTYSIGSVSGATSYQWTVSGGGSIVSGGTSTSATINWTTAGGPYTVSVVAQNVCGNSTAQTVQVNVQPGAPSTPGPITGGNNICLSNQSYSIQSVSGATGYTWSVSGGGAIASGQNTTNANINWVSGGTYTISVTANGICGSSAPQTLQVTVVANAPVISGGITGNTNVCPGNHTYTATATGATNYTWTVQSPGTIQSGQGTSSITVNWPSTAGTYTISVVASNVCGNSSPASSLVTVIGGAPSQPGVISGNNNPCQGTSAYSITAVSGATNYVWTLSGGGNIQTGQGTTSININWITTGGPYTLSVLAENACGSSTVSSLAINVQPGTPLVPAAISGDDNLCPGTATYSIPSVSGADTYTWTLSGGGNISSGQNTNLILVNWTQSGNHTVSVTAGNSCSTSQPVTLNVSVLPGAPDAPANISGQNFVCANAIQTYSINSVLNASNYQWTLPNGGGTITSGNGTTQVDIDWGANPGTYNLNVTAENSCGVSAPASITVTLLPGAPAQPSAISGNLEVCPGVSQYTVTSDPIATGYNWSLSAGGVITNGQGTNTLSIDWSGAPGTYSVSVTAGNTCGNSPPQTVSVTIFPSPTVPLLTVNNATICEGESVTLTASGSSGGNISYQIFDAAIGGNLLGNSPLSVSPTATTTYYAEALNEFGCVNSGGRTPATITVNSAASNPIISAESETACYNSSVALTATATPAGSVVTWWDSLTGGTLLGTGSTFVMDNLTETTVFYAQAASPAGCQNAGGRIGFEVNVIELLQLTLVSDKDQNAVFFNEVITFTALPDGLQGYEFFVNGISVQQGAENIYASSRFSDGDSVVVKAINNDCPALDAEGIIRVRDFPNAFTPNGDNRNDIFLKGFDLVVMNRWGQEMYRGTDGWDGTFKGKKVAPGTYFYILTLPNITDRDNIVKGSVMLIQD